MCLVCPPSVSQTARQSELRVSSSRDTSPQVEEQISGLVKISAQSRYLGPGVIL